MAYLLFAAAIVAAFSIAYRIRNRGTDDPARSVSSFQKSIDALKPPTQKRRG